MIDWQRIEFPAPISTNALFRNVAGSGRVKTSQYRAWIEDAGWRIVMAKPCRIMGAAEVHILISNASRIDADNAAKAVLDVLTKHQVIEDDRRVRKLTIEFGDTPSQLVSVRPLIGETA